MPNLEPTVIEGRSYALRHIGPKTTLWPNTPGAVAAFALLGEPAIVARPLPMANIPNSPDFVSGTWTGRLDDAGEMSLTFPNKEASDGTPWRSRFDPTGKLQWVEIYQDEYLESVCCVQKVQSARDQITVSGYDGLFQLKSAYERDWIVTQAPRDVIERGTQVWVPVLVDTFPAGALNAQWTVTTAAGGTVTVGASGGVTLQAVGNSAEAQIQSAIDAVAATGAWRFNCNIEYIFMSGGAPGFSLQVTESGATYTTTVIPGVAGDPAAIQLSDGSAVAQIQIPNSPTYALQVESDGEWVTAYCNGLLVGGMRRSAASTTSLRVTAQALNGPGAPTTTAVLRGMLLETMQPFLMRGTDKGDYVLPGRASTYPTGGLTARYFNNADLGGDASRGSKIHHPSRTQAYAGTGTNEYASQQDARVAGQSNPAGAAGSYWSCVWFGSVWLKLSAGNYTFAITMPAVANDAAVKVFIGKTTLGSQWLGNSGGFVYNNTSSQQFQFTVSASQLAGTLSYDGNKVQRDGWYPIKIEYSVNATSATAPTFQLISSPAAYTDPGGTVIASGAQTTTVPASSLSPLGCVDQRHQGISHFDLVQRTLQAFGYHTSLEPRQLESGLFPGVLAPRLREGHDTDLVLEPDDKPRAEGLLDYSNVLDATDCASSMWGNGAGFNNGTQGQLQSFAYDPVSILSDLFDLQGWQDFSDASFLELLQALLNTELGLRIDPWQLIAASPIARQRLANVWPLSTALSQMRWRPGDGMRVLARDVNIEDLTPRQVLLITRSIHPNGSTGAQVGFAARPKGSEVALHKQLHSTSRLQRNYQKQLTTLNGNAVSSAPVPAGQTSGQASIITLHPSDLVVRAWLRVSAAAGSFNVVINGADVTTALNGPWPVAPALINLGPSVAPDSTGAQVAVQLHNNGVARGLFSWQLLLDVQR